MQMCRSCSRRRFFYCPFRFLFAVAVLAGAVAGNKRVTAGALFGFGLCFVCVDIDFVKSTEVFRFCVICTRYNITFYTMVCIFVFHNKISSVFGLKILFPKTEDIFIFYLLNYSKNQRYSMLFLTVLYFS